MRPRSIYRALLLVGCSTLVATVALSAEAEQAPRLYTNADLDRLGPPPASPSKPIPQVDLGWDYVQSFIDREHARIGAERADSLSRLATEQESEALATLYGRHVYTSPYLGVFGLNRPWNHLSRMDHGLRRAGKPLDSRHALRGPLRRLDKGVRHPRSHRP